MNGLHQRNVRVDDNNKRENPPLDALQLTIEPTEPSVSEQEPADILQTDKDATQLRRLQLIQLNMDA